MYFIHTFTPTVIPVKTGIQVANCLDSRLPLGHELEAEWRGNDNKVDYAENTYVYVAGRLDPRN